MTHKRRLSVRLCRMTVLGFVATFCPCIVVGAQGWDGAEIGSRVSLRVVDSMLPAGLPRKNAIVGLVARREPQALYVSITSDDTLRISHVTIVRMYVSRGVSRRRSAFRLALVEGALFTLLPPLRGDYFDSEHVQRIGFAVVGGGVIGALFPREEWKRLRP
jgi:hypothetical protein